MTALGLNLNHSGSQAHLVEELGLEADCTCAASWRLTKGWILLLWFFSTFFLTLCSRTNHMLKLCQCMAKDNANSTIASQNLVEQTICQQVQCLQSYTNDQTRTLCMSRRLKQKTGSFNPFACGPSIRFKQVSELPFANALRRKLLRRHWKRTEKIVKGRNSTYKKSCSGAAFSQ